MNIFAANLNLKVNNVEVLKDISFTISEGKFSCLTGPSGAGKSSILKVVFGDIDYYTGFITKVHWKEMSYVPQNIPPPAFLDVYEVVSLGLYNRKLTGGESKELIEELLVRCGLVEIRHRKFTDISAGEKQRVWLAFALAQSKDLMLMDEPLANLDNAGKMAFFQLLRDVVDGGKTLLLVTHDIELAVKYSDHIITIVDGEKIYDGSPLNFRSSQALSEHKVFNISN